MPQLNREPEGVVMVRLLRFSGVRVALLGVAFALVMAASASAATTVTVGQTNPAALDCEAGEAAGSWVAQEGSASDVVPAGEWVLTSWSTYASGDVGLIVFQPTGSGSYTVVGESPVETITTTDTLSTFAVSIPVQPGDLIGIWLPVYPNVLQHCLTTGVPGSDIQVNGASAEPTVGSVVVSAEVMSGWRLDLSATLTPYTPSALCAATEAYVNGSAASRTARSSIYSRLDTAQACGALFGGFTNAYESDVTRLYDNGWLTATQEANLEAAASYL
jgi:hypothetical protein